MPEINIPGDELETASSNMQQVLNLFGDSGGSPPDLETALGASDTLVSGAANHFDSRWSAGRSQLKDEGQKIIDALNQIISAFTDTDNNLGNQLTPNSGNSSS
jgi:hypothetical protein